MIDKLEKKFGKYAIENLIYYILGGYAIGYILLLLQSRVDLYQYITMDPSLVMQGQVWRLFTWILTPPDSLSILVIFMFMFFFFIGRSLEQTFGAFRYNLYMFSGWFFMTLGAMAFYWITDAMTDGLAGISMGISTYYLNMASFLAFAVIYPDVKVYFFGIIPIKIKILAWIDVGFLGMEIISSLSMLILHNSSYEVIKTMYDSMLSQLGVADSYIVVFCLTEVFSIIISLLNFLIFFIMNRKARNDAKRRRQNFQRAAEAGRAQARQSAYNRANGAYAGTAAQANSEKKSFRPSTDNNEIVHVCTICGRTSKTNPELSFRYCSKCSGNHAYCQDHLFTHEHIK